MHLIGKATISPIWFYSGKVAGYLTWLALLLSITQVIDIRPYRALILDYASFVTAAVGITLSVISVLNLGQSTTLGIPTKQTSFKKTGLYKVSRNPIYIGFNLLTIASIVYHSNWYVGILGVYSMVIYHAIILGEEKYLEKHFPEEYAEYKAKVRRYI